MKVARDIWEWLKPNWLYGAIAVATLGMASLVTLIQFLPIYVVLLLLGYNIGTQFDEHAWWADRNLIALAIFVPFVMRNFLLMMSYAASFEPAAIREVRSRKVSA